MIEQVEVVIPTLFRPVTLGPLVSSLREQGVDKVTVMQDMPVNDAWRRGYAEATRRWLFILNDDIEISPRFVAEMLYGHGLGLTYVYASRVDRFSGLSREVVNNISRGAHLGEAFSMDMECPIPPIPEEFKIYHGDDWYYWYHHKVGRCGQSSGAQYKTEESFTGKHPDVNSYMQRWFGTTLDGVGRREHLAARKYFIIPNGVRWIMDEAGVDYTVTATDTNRAFMGSAAGILE